MNSNIKEISTLRKQLHQAPEVSGKEQKTSDQIRAFFEDLSPDEIVDDLGKHGLAIVFNGQENGPTTLIRAELDALPILENNSFSYKSKSNGVAHSCGHDGHMAILCGVGLKLAKKRPKYGRVILLFQPSEETGMGAAQVISSPNFPKIKPDFAFALHNLPGYDLGEVVLKKGAFTAASKGMIINLKGRTSHAAHPEDAISPANAMCQLISGLQKLPEDIQEFSLVTVIHAQLGEVAFGTTPGTATVMATLRTFDNEVMNTLTESAMSLSQKISDLHGLECSISFTEEFQVVENDIEAYNPVDDAVTKLGLHKRISQTPFRWSEDFGALSSTTKSMLFGLGAGKTHPQLHENSYDFPDELLPIGVDLFYTIIEKLNH
ncbi:amidohydrolase [Cyclobacterium qasimii]|uniref:Peptidase M20 n=2 Tax=Cyclobacterium qasimii TaxID=1350429 RepID=A0A512CI49_9BACT|nr:amidohydrolase [Cyclobacterium qasimii]EPR68937.1 putative hydrolase [Cyclobacterium qasimii M12-11B]GEO23891.1 peptidase M20 [Cyclobacterium qasimii]